MIVARATSWNPKLPGLRARAMRTAHDCSSKFLGKPAERSTQSRGHVEVKITIGFIYCNPDPRLWNHQYWDAWDVDVFHLAQRKALNAPGGVDVTVDDASGADGQGFSMRLASGTRIDFAVRLPSDARHVCLTADVFWAEAHKFLKVEHALDIRADEAAFETQFGHVRRPTHFNTSHDVARFEVCAHRWADLSEYGYGVALASDNKYGYAVHGNVMRLSLLRSPKNPAEDADMSLPGTVHATRSALMPHTGGLSPRVVRDAIAFASHDDHVVALLPQGTAAVQPLLERPLVAVLNSSAAIVDTVKPAEDDDAAVVVRIYEAMGGRTSTTVAFGRTPSAVHLCNALEDVAAPLDVVDGAVRIALTPFQIVSLLVRF